jgi:hypothetical protein
MKPLAKMYERPAKIWANRYSREEPGRQSFKAIPSETKETFSVSGGLLTEMRRVSFTNLRLG